MAGLSAVGDQAKQAALEAVDAKLTEALGADALAEQIEAALRDRLASLDQRALAEKVAMQAVGPVMEAIDGRLEGFDPESLKPLLEDLQERIRTLEQGGYS